MDLSHVVWIGGPRGSGKSTVADALAERLSLQAYHVDEHTHAHAARMPTGELETASLASFMTHSRHRVRLVLEDLRELPDQPPCVVEGEQLMPTSVSALLRFADQALFLLADLVGDASELDVLIAQTIEREARELRLPVLRVEGSVEETIESAVEMLSPVVERLATSG